jgi:4-amino-4-deoxy-L-arabinose transferase-like glycosyltransferase
MVEYREPHAVRICLLIATAAVIQAWTLRHHEARLPDALRSIQQAEQIERGDWRSGVMQGLDHPLHPLGIVAARQIVGGEGPIAWQRAALAVAFGCVILWVVPLYLLAWEATDSKAAWLGCLMMAANPLVGQLVVNGLSETTFLLFWTSGLWAALRFLRDGRLRWLSATLGLSVLGYLARPEGLLLPLSLILVLLILPLHRSTRILWPRWRRAVAALALGSLALAGPFMAIKGGPGTRPAVARVLGLAPSVPPDAPEREQPAETGRTPLQTHRDSFRGSWPR